MWFNEIANAQNPSRRELSFFVHNVREFLYFVLEDSINFGFLWQNAPELLEFAKQTFRYDIAEGAGLELDKAIELIPSGAIYIHGLEGRPLRFKIQVLDSLGNQWERLKGQFSVKEWFKKMIEAIDAILDSLIDAAGGAGGLIKEFKDALYALA